MSATTLVLDTTWPTNVAGHRDTSPEAVQMLHTRVDALGDAVLIDIADICHGQTLTELGRNLDEDGDAKEGHNDVLERARQYLRGELHSAVNEIPDIEEDLVWYYDGLRWRVAITEVSTGDLSQYYRNIEMIDASFICVAPTDGDEFRDVGAVTAAIAVLDEVAGLALTALAAAGFTDYQRRTAEAALEAARQNVLGTAKTIRKGLDSARAAA